VGFISFRTLNGHASFHPDADAPLLRAREVSAWHDARGLVAHAQSQAEDIVGRAQEAFEAERRRGYQEGYEQARLEEAERMIDAVGRTVDYLGSVETEMVELVLTAVRKIFSDFNDQERVLIVARGALAALRQQKQMTLRVEPGQCEPLKARMSELLADFPNVGFIEIVPDPRLQADACILESEIGSVEASIDGQIQALRKSLERFLGSKA
jgi:type III secretion protein L